MALANLAAVPLVGIDAVAGCGAPDGARVALVPPDLEVDAAVGVVGGDGDVGDVPRAPSLGDVVALGECGDGASRNGRDQGGGRGEDGGGTHFDGVMR